MAALIASRHLLCITPAAAVYPEAQKGDAWACSMCNESFLIDNSQFLRRYNQHKRSPGMYQCTRAGCNHRECRWCFSLSVLPRPPCDACTPRATPLPSSHSPPFSPLPVCIWEGLGRGWTRARGWSGLYRERVRRMEALIIPIVACSPRACKKQLLLNARGSL